MTSSSSLLNTLFYDQTSCALSIREHKTITVSAPYIYQPQNARNALWRDCVEFQKTFRECYELKGKNLKLLIEQGLNKNFFTRDRWLDIEFISLELKLSLDEFINKFEISDSQRADWKLKKIEKQRWRANHLLSTTM